jgi:enterochelin esterase-like enzyme
MEGAQTVYPSSSSGQDVVHSVPALPESVTGPARHPGLLEDPRLATVLVIAGLLVIAGWAVASIRRRRVGAPSSRLGRRVALTVLAALPLLSGTAVAVNSYVGYVPTVSALARLVAPGIRPPPAPVGAPTGARDGKTTWPDGTVQAAGPSQLVELAVPGPGLGMPNLPVLALLPPGYSDPANATIRYPVVYLLHGYPGSPYDWFRAGRPQETADLMLAKHLIRPAILIFPSTTPSWGHDTECLNARSGVSAETYLTSTVPAAVDHTFRTRDDRGGRAIGGTSSGAYCALNLGLRHLDRFSVIIAMMPYGDPGQNAARSLLAGDRSALEANSPAVYVRTMRFSRPVAVLLSAAAGDRQPVATARTIAAGLAARGQYAALRVAPGLGHTWRETRAELPYALAFADRHLLPAGG